MTFNEWQNLAEDDSLKVGLLAFARRQVQEELRAKDREISYLRMEIGQLRKPPDNPRGRPK
jgi:hypothetical protein